jgi:hypothetical protein
VLSRINSNPTRQHDAVKRSRSADACHVNAARLDVLEVKKVGAILESRVRRCDRKLCRSSRRSPRRAALTLGHHRRAHQNGSCGLKAADIRLLGERPRKAREVATLSSRRRSTLFWRPQALGANAPMPP